MRVRLDRALSKRGLASRAEAQRLIHAGQVTLSGLVVTDPSHLVEPETASIAIAGTVARAAVWRTIALHKPRGIVTTRRDPEGRKTVFRRLLQAVGHEVTRLLRVAFGGIELGTLQPGAWRDVTRNEVAEAFPLTRPSVRRADRSSSRAGRG